MLSSLSFDGFRPVPSRWRRCPLKRNANIITDNANTSKNNANIIPNNANIIGKRSAPPATRDGDTTLKGHRHPPQGPAPPRLVPPSSSSFWSGTRMACGHTLDQANTHVPTAPAQVRIRHPLAFASVFCYNTRRQRQKCRSHRQAEKSPLVARSNPRHLFLKAWRIR